MKKIAKLCFIITFLYALAMLLLYLFAIRVPDGNLTYDFTEAKSVTSKARSFVSINNKSIHMDFPIQKDDESNQCFFYVTMSKGGKFCIGKADENGYFKKDNKYNFPYKDDIIYIIQFSVLGLKNQSIDFLNIDDESNYKVNGSVINSKAEGIKYKRLNDEDGVKNILNMSDNSNLSISGKAAFFKLNDFIVYKIKQLEGDTYEVIDEYNFSNSEKFLKLSSYKINYIVCSQDKESRINNCSVPHIVLPSNRITLKNIDELYMENTSGNL